jgi:DNA repair protein RadC
MGIQGIGESLSGRILSAVELGRRLSLLEVEEQPTISSTAAAAALLQYEMSALEQESLRTILLDARNRLIRVHEVYKGSLTTSLIRTGEVFREAIKANAAGMIVVHNHPSGDPSPSPEDLAVTRILIEAGRLLDIPVLDHIVIGRTRFVSMREQGLGFAEK